MGVGGTDAKKSSSFETLRFGRMSWSNDELRESRWDGESLTLDVDATGSGGDRGRGGDVSGGDA